MRFTVEMTEREYRALLSLVGEYLIASMRDGSRLPQAFLLATDANDEETTAGDLLALLLNRAVAS